MKTKIIIIFALFLSFFYYAQQESLNIDLLKAPASPASNLLDIAPSEINKPTDVSNLILNLQDFTSMFKNNAGYALDFAPYWLCEKQTKSLDNILKDTSISDVIKQTFVLSVAIKNTDSTNFKLPINSVFTSLGFKFSFFRGDVSVDILNKYRDIKNIHRNIINASKISIDIVNSDTDVLKKEKIISDLIKKLPRNQTTSIEIENLTNELNEQKNEMLKSLQDSKKDDENNFTKNSELIKEKLKDFTIKRTGFLWDFAGGTSLQFKEKQFNNSRVYNAGLWTVLGYAFEKSGTPLFLLRYMYNPKSDWMTIEDFKPNGNFSTFDAGVKYEYSPKDSKFTGSVEGLYRSFISGSDLKPTWKCVLNLDYAIFPNQHLTLSLGKDFDNNIIKNGNVIAGLSFLSGIGTKRKIQ